MSFNIVINNHNAKISSDDIVKQLYKLDILVDMMNNEITTLNSQMQYVKNNPNILNQDIKLIHNTVKRIIRRNDLSLPYDLQITWGEFCDEFSKDFNKRFDENFQLNKE